MIAIVQATFPDRVTAGRIARTVIDERLAACVNLLESCRSIYRWRGAVEEADEVVAQFKTAPDRVEALVERLKALHSYELPAIEWWKVTAASALKEWVELETR